MKDFYLYHSVLSQAQILACANGSHPNGFAFGVAGDGADAANWQDLSGTGNHGTVFNSEQCLIHRRGAVIRTDGNGDRYTV